MDKDVESRFLRAVRGHRLSVQLDQGTHRHLRLSRRNSPVYRFDLVTWPGHLAISGDLDDFTFTRLNDMFDFFRFAGPEYQKTDYPNYDYWAEKCTAAYTRGSMKTFSYDLYERAIKDDMDSHTDYMTPEEALECREDADLHGLFDDADDARSAVERAMEWHCPVTREHPFIEFYEHHLEDYSFGFKFACHAIQWGIKQYDLARQSRDQSSHDKRVLEGLT